MGSMPTATTDVFVARQPIFDARQQVFAYELLFRSGPENCFEGSPDSLGPTSQVISHGMLVGLDTLTDQKPAFVNFNQASLANDLAFALPAQQVVIEILETVPADHDVLAACRRLKTAGYRIALDDFADEPERQPLIEHADFIKVDVLSSSPDDRRKLIRTYRSPTRRILAEKVETLEVLHETTTEGCEYFQGYFFSRPTIVKGKAIPGFRLNYLRLLHELNRPDVDMRRLEQVIKQEASIAYRLLRRVNSAAYGFRVQTSSLQHALVLLGEREIRVCATVWAFAEMGRDLPVELVVASTLRARFCELLAPATGLSARASDLFLVGMFSLLDVIFQRPMEEIVATLPLADDVQDALMGHPNRLRAVLECVIAYERGDWATALARAASADLDEYQLPSRYLDAVAWTREIFH